MQKHVVMYRNEDILSILSNKAHNPLAHDGAFNVLVNLLPTPVDTLMLMLMECSGLVLDEVGDNTLDFDGMSRFDMTFSTFTNYESCPFYWESETLNLFGEYLLDEISKCLSENWSLIIDDDILSEITYLLNDVIYVVIGMVANKFTLAFTGGVTVRTRVGYIRGEAILFSSPEIVE